MAANCCCWAAGWPPRPLGRPSRLPGLPASSSRCRWSGRPRGSPTTVKPARQASELGLVGEVGRADAGAGLGAVGAVRQAAGDEVTGLPGAARVVPPAVAGVAGEASPTRSPGRWAWTVPVRATPMTLWWTGCRTTWRTRRVAPGTGVDEPIGGGPQTVASGTANSIRPRRQLSQNRLLAITLSLPPASHRPVPTGAGMNGSTSRVRPERVEVVVVEVVVPRYTLPCCGKPGWPGAVNTSVV